MTLELVVNSWIAANGGSEEVRQTTASLRIMLGDRVATRVVDDWSKSVRDDVYLSAYPLALWFASSWWRLRWEPTPYSGSRPSASWRMAHEMAAAGCGFIWPRLTFESDSETIKVSCHPTNTTSIEPIRYLEDFHAWIPASEFEDAVDAFVNLVLARLDTIGIRNTELRTLWNEVRAERADKQASRYRRLEAMLGYEPDEAPNGIVSRLEDLSLEAGEAATAEIALACAGDNPATALDNIINLARSQGIPGRVQQASELMTAFKATDSGHTVPWERGWQLARIARNFWGIDTDCVSDDTLSNLLEIEARSFDSVGDTPKRIGLAIRNGASDGLKLLLQKRNPVGRRFEATRLLGDYLVAPATDHWLPATETKTVRQKVQRAFAAEFLCPIRALLEFLNGDFSDEAYEDAGAHFAVSSVAVHSHLANNHLLPPWSQ